MKPTRPILRYHGGKYRLSTWVIEHFPPHRVYVEPFGGAGSVLMRKPRAYAEVYNDKWDEVVNVFRVLRDPVKAARLRALLELTPFSRVEFREAYSAEPVDDVDRARMTVVRSFMGFGSASMSTGYQSGFRANSNRSHTTPAKDWTTWPNQVPAFVRRLQAVVIENRDAAEVMLQHDGEDTLHYVDPPYVHSTRTADRDRNRASYVHELTDDDHRALATVLRGLKGAVILSGYPSPLYSELYGDWTCDEVSALADGALERTEALWMNARCVAMQKRAAAPLFAGEGL